MISWISVLLGLSFAGVVCAVRGVDQEIFELEHTKSPLLRYPTQYTQDIVPNRVHSHNDCTRNNEY
jgi:hypothetical protein